MSDDNWKPKKSDQDDWSSGNSQKSSPKEAVLETVRTMLRAITPDKWEHGGEALDTKKRFSRSQETWEELFYTETKAGTLVIRSSISLSHSYVSGGYVYSPNGAPRFSIELRGKGWSPKALLEPNLRNPGWVEPAVQVLAHGVVAEQLFREVQNVVGVYRDSLRREFNDKVARMTSSIKESLSETTPSDWQVTKHDDGSTSYHADVDGINVVSSSRVTDVGTSYSLSLGAYGFSWACRDAQLAQEVFSLIDDAAQTASLENLKKVLDEMS